MYKPRVKICCISSIEEANLAISYGASALGLVSEMPSGPGVISEEMITIKLLHNISSELEDNSSYFCYFLNGLLTGFGEFALYRVNVIETQCCLEDLNQEYCEFRIEIKNK